MDYEDAVDGIVSQFSPKRLRLFDDAVRYNETPFYAIVKEPTFQLLGYGDYDLQLDGMEPLKLNQVPSEVNSRAACYWRPTQST